MPTVPDRDSENKALVAYALDIVRARTKSLTALAASLVLLAASVGYLIVVVMIDHGLQGGIPLGFRRFGLGLFGSILFFLAITRVVIPLFRRISAFYAARVIERANPTFRNALVTALDLQQRPDAHNGIAAGLNQRSARHLRRCNVAESVPQRSWRRSVWIVTASVALFGLYSVFAPKQVTPSVIRALGGDVPAPRRTNVTIVQPREDASVVVGTPVDFEVALDGHVPSEVLVEFSRDAGASWVRGQRLSMKPVFVRAGDDRDPRSWRGTKAGNDVVASMWYRVTAGDCQTDLRRLEVRPVPRVGKATVSLTYPEYTGRAPETVGTGQIDAIVGTRVDISAGTNVPAGSARVVFHDAHGPVARQMQIDGADGRVLKASWIVDRDVEYELRFGDRHGAPNVNPIRYRQHARRDLPPVVEHESPQPRSVVAPDGQFAVRAGISDDIGLTDVGIDYRVGVRTGHLRLLSPADVGSARVVLDRVFSVSRFKAVAGDLIQFHLVAKDNRHDLRGRPAFQVSTGPECEVQVARPERERATERDAEASPPMKPSKRDDPRTTDKDRSQDDSEKGGESAGDTSDSNSDSGQSKSDGSKAESEDRNDDGRSDKQEAEKAEKKGQDAGEDDAREDPESKRSSRDGRGEDDLDRFIEKNRKKLDRLGEAMDRNKGGQKGRSSSDQDGADSKKKDDTGVDRDERNYERNSDRKQPPNEPGESQAKGDDSRQTRGDEAENGGDEKEGDRPGPSAESDGSRERSGAREDRAAAEKEESEHGQAGGDESEGESGTKKQQGNRSGEAGERESKPETASEGEKQTEGKKGETGEPREGKEPRDSQTDRQVEETRTGKSKPAGDRNAKDPDESGAEGREREQEGNANEGQGQEPRDGNGDKQGEGKGESRSQGSTKDQGKGEGEGNGQGVGEGQGQGEGDGTVGKGKNGQGQGDGAGSGGTKGGEPQGEGAGKNPGAGESSKDGQSGQEGSKRNAQDGDRDNAGPGERAGGEPGAGKGGREGTGGPGQAKPNEEKPGDAGEAGHGGHAGGGATGPPAEGQGEDNGRVQKAGPADLHRENHDSGDEEEPDDGRFTGEGDTEGLEGQERESARRAVDELERRLNRGDVDQDVLEDLGWTEAEARKFVREFRRREQRGQRDVTRRFTGRETGKDARPTGQGERLEGEGVGPGVRSAGLTEVRRSDQTAEGVRERQPEKVPPEYSDLLREYYRSMSRSRRNRTDLP